MNTITFGEWEGCFLAIFMHTIKNSGGYFYWGRLFLWILDIILKNFVRGYFSNFSVRALNMGKSNLRWASSTLKLMAHFQLWHLIILPTDHIWSPSTNFERPRQGQNFLAATFRQKGVWFPMHIDHLTFYGPSQYLSSFLSNRPKSKKNPFFTDFLVRPPKKLWARVRSIDATNLPHS